MTSTSKPPTQRAAPAPEAARALSRLLGPLRRGVLRRTRERADLPDLPDAQIELLRALEAAPGSSVGAVAARLRVAPTTVSNLVRAMTADGLVERRASALDRRTAELWASPPALALLRRYDDMSAALLDDALAGLRPADRRAVLRAVPALERLLARIEQDGTAS